MNSLFNFSGLEAWHIAGWTMLHFLWIGALVGLATAIFRLFIRRAAPNLRYAAALSSFVILAVLPLGVAAWLATSPRYDNLQPTQTAARNAPSESQVLNFPPLKAGARGETNPNQNFVPTNEPIELKNIDLASSDLPASDNASHTSSTANSVEISTSPAPTTPSSAGGTLAAEQTHPITQLGQEDSTLPQQGWALLTRRLPIEACVPYLPWLWMIGTPITFALLAAGLVGTKRLRSASRITEDPRIHELLGRLTQSLRISRRVSVAICDRIASPVLIGILRPIILLPPAALTGWSPDEIEMVLLHELAHVRRWDNLVNLLQRIVESLLFFHPAVWLTSAWVRRERESCCDALVVSRTERPHAYAELLVALAAQMPRSVLFHPAASSAMSAGPLRSRIRQILQLDDDPMLVSGKSFAAIAAAVVATALAAIVYLPTTGKADEPQPKTKTEIAVESSSTTPSTDRYESPTTNFPNVPQTTEKPKDAASQPAAQEEVFATVPPDNPDTHGLNLLTMYESALKQGKYVDLVLRGGKQLLIVVPQPTESNWPEVLGESPRKDRVIAEKAWQRYGLKLAPVSNAEANYRAQLGMPGNILIVGGNVPKGLPLPAILTSIDGHAISNMTELLANIETIERRKDSVRCLALSRDPEQSKEYLFDTQSPTTEQGRTSTFEQIPPPWETAKAVRPTPTQPSAPEPRVIAAYEVTAELIPLMEVFLKANEIRGVFDQRGRLILQTSPTLHARIKRILEEAPKWRDPAAALERNKQPLVRRDPYGKQVLEWRTVGLTFKEESRPNLRPPTSGGGVEVVGVAPGSPADWLNIRPGDSLRSVDTFQTANLQELQDVVTTLLESFPTQSKEVQARFWRPSSNLPNGKSQLILNLELRPDDPNAEGSDQQRILRHEAIERSRQEQAQQRTEAPAAVNQPANSDNAPQSPEEIAASSGGTPKEDFLYDGKPFQEWRALWQNELSAAKRADAVRALTAFGRVGYGKEATTVILDVAAEYDFLTYTQDAESKLKEAILDSLAPSHRRQDLVKFWLPDLVERLQENPKKWRDFTGQMLYRIRTDDPAVLDVLQSFAESGPAELRTEALAVIVANDKLQPQNGVPSLNERARQLLAKALGSDDPATVNRALQLLLYYDQSAYSGGMGGGMGPTATPTLMYQPELLPILFHPDEDIRKNARRVLQSIQKKDAPQAVEYLMARLKDGSRKDDYLHAIRALATMGKHAESVRPQLATVLKNSDDEKLSAALLVALVRIADLPLLKVVPDGKIALNGDSITTSADGLLNQAELETVISKFADGKNLDELLLRENEALFPNTNQQNLGGGGFF